jgi:RLL motif containing protein 1
VYGHIGTTKRTVSSLTMSASNRFITLLLEALGVPQANKFDIKDLSQVQQLVLWLENTKIRHYTVEDRAGRLQSPDASAFQLALKKYALDLECPAVYNIDTPSSSNLPRIIKWLLMHALSLEYQDSADQLNAVASEAVEHSIPPEADTQRVLPPYSDAASDNVVAAIQQVCDILHLSSSSSLYPPTTTEDREAQVLQRINAITEMLEVLPIFLDISTKSTIVAMEEDVVEEGESGQDQQQQQKQLLLTRFPLGFNTGDDDVDRAATLLRMMYIKDLRELQTMVDQGIVDVQEKTVRTIDMADAALGKVGR